jgi:hypothetical protein
MTYWAEKYIGRPWTDREDCFFWFQKIQKDEFDRDCPLVMVDPSKRLLNAARIMKGDIKTAFGYRPTEAPQDGDAVFLSQRTQAHHIGTIVIINGLTYIIHALEGVGVILSDKLSLNLNGWKIRGYWTICG